jgi:hypothetical protein
MAEWGWRELLMWLVLSVATYIIVVSVRNAESLAWFFGFSDSWSASALYTTALLAGVVEQFSLLGALIIIGFATLLSLNLVLLGHFVISNQAGPLSKKDRAQLSAHGIGGTVAAVLGIGCATCGAALLFGLLSVIGATGLLAWLPLEGEEFGLLGVALLAYSAWFFSGKLAGPKVC